MKIGLSAVPSEMISRSKSGTSGQKNDGIQPLLKRFDDDGIKVSKSIHSPPEPARGPF